jgi:gliding motility-associated-like protein
MNRRVSFFIVFITGAITAGWQSAHAFTSLQKVSLSASVTMGNGLGNITITAQPLPPQAFFGKNVVIPVTVASGGSLIDTSNLRIEMLYQMVDSNGSALNPVTSVPIIFEKNPLKPNQLQGTAILPLDNIGPLSNGGQLLYYFHAQQGAGSIFLSAGGLSPTGSAAGAVLASSDAFKTQIINSLTQPVSPDGSTVSLPDTAEPDRPSSIQFAPGALSSPGTLLVERKNEATYPSFQGIKPIEVYTFTLQGTSVVRNAQITLGYPSDTNGNVTGTNNSPGANLAMYYMDTYGWRILGRPVVDTTLHTVTTIAPQFATLALIPTGAIGASDLRPTQRIITPNGDGINDTASFSGVDGDIHIFDIRGRRVKTISSANPLWDGTDDSGRIVESGVYLYQYKSQGERVSGVIGVAK